MNNTPIKRTCKAFAPATVANVGPGFDVLGLALEGLGDTVEVEIETGPPGVFLKDVTGDGGQLPRDPARNTASVAVMEMLRFRGLLEDMRVNVTLHKGLPLGSGMGSSAASAVAAIVAIDGLFEDDVPLRNQLSIAAECERVACGAAHMDNVAPSLMGGIVLLPPREASPVSLPVPEGLWCGVVHPHLELRTEDSRAVLPSQVSLQVATEAMGQLALLISALYEGNISRLGKALEDRLVTPYRAPLVPGLLEGLKGLDGTPVIGGGLSGSGPSAFVLGEGKESCESGMAVLSRAFERAGLKSDQCSSRIGSGGAHVLP